ncbi:hypothetical protein Hsw_2097 [Hymenobacter swuensis DY53]|uniref:Uncharacterized protein n=1 Tax=Hymenobacter swuensis DY53 TaxID=1227739 RepID=W8F0Y6_9BACT|nr:hypothetical protein Hsw_2097 [Hymenobacter swuensis DY53]
MLFRSCAVARQNTVDFLRSFFPDYLRCCSGFRPFKPNQ